MHRNPRAGNDARPEKSEPALWRESLRDLALQNAIMKREKGVPTYSVPEAAALLSISQEYLYRLIQAGNFPAVRMQIGSKQGRYVVPAKAVEQLLDEAFELPAGTGKQAASGGVR